MGYQVQEGIKTHRGGISRQGKSRVESPRNGFRGGMGCATLYYVCRDNTRRSNGNNLFHYCLNEHVNGIGAGKTKVKIVASPSAKQNIHQIEIESSAGRVVTRSENVLHPDNPKTSYLAVLSAVATLEQIVAPVKIGT